MTVSLFWQKVEACDHDWSDTYDEGGACGTDYCDWSESHCRKCGVYVTECLCGACNGQSGWPYRKWRRLERKQKQRREQVQR